MGYISHHEELLARVAMVKDRVHVNWNGATAVSIWVLLCTRSETEARDSKPVHLVTVLENGSETKIVAPKNPAFSYFMWVLRRGRPASQSDHDSGMAISQVTGQWPSACTLWARKREECRVV